MTACPPRTGRTRRVSYLKLVGEKLSGNDACLVQAEVAAPPPGAGEPMMM
jgi:hypothetical protein